MTKLELTSIGQFASELRVSTKFIREIAEKLGINPSAIINRVPHYSEQDLRRIGDAIRSAEESQ